MFDFFYEIEFTNTLLIIAIYLIVKIGNEITRELREISKNTHEMESSLLDDEFEEYE